MEQVFLGGTCAHTTWRRDIAIPLLENAGITYHNPQLAPGAWTPDHQYAEMRAKEAADVWLFVITGDSRGVASIGEVAYRIGQDRPIALALMDIPENAVFEGKPILENERNDLNRGRVFLKAMAEEAGVPVFLSVADATEYAIHLARQAQAALNIERLRALVAEVQLPGYTFLCTRLAGVFTVQVQKEEINQHTGISELMYGRQWIIAPSATRGEVVRTLLKAAITWEEHELREKFRLDGRTIFNPHFEV